MDYTQNLQEFLDALSAEEKLKLFEELYQSDFAQYDTTNLVQNIKQVRALKAAKAYYQYQHKMLERELLTCQPAEVDGLIGRIGKASGILEFIQLLLDISTQPQPQPESN
jgi:hypothetical protein